MPNDQDSFNNQSLQDPVDLVARMNALTEEDLGRGAVGHRHVPQGWKLPTGVHSKFGSHGVFPGQELYANPAPEGTSPTSGLPFPAWDPVAYGGTIMDIVAPNPPYGAGTGQGWRILSPNNSTVDAAVVQAQLNYNDGSVFALGGGSLDISCWTEATNGWDGSTADPVSPLAFGPILAVALRIDDEWYVVPDSMAMYSGTLWGDSVHARCRVTAALCNTLAPGGVQLEDIAMVVCMRRKTDFSDGSQVPAIFLGNWGISVDPFLSVEQ